MKSIRSVRIIEACRQQGVPEPTYEERGGFIHIIFERKSFTLSDDTQNDTQNNLTERQNKIVEILKRNNRTRIDELCRVFPKSESTIIRDIRNIRKHVSLSWVGPSKGGHWEIRE